jgi:SAM-dependent methyltransferase/uncharacterized protein YbaR (Trm112 family)
MTQEIAESLVPEIEELLRCPVCRAPLRGAEDGYRCTELPEVHVYPRIGGVPILLDDERSLVPIEDYLRPTGSVDSTPASLWGRLYSRFPSLTFSRASADNYRVLARILREETVQARVLVVGGRIQGHGMEDVFSDNRIQLIETDVAFGPRTHIICDVHALPFRDASFDAVIAQAVLEHVVDPYQAVQEIRRVLRCRGLVYAEVPFMQQVHGHAFDFTRFTALGLRRLFRQFEAIDSGIASGPGSALAWTLRYFAEALAGTRLLRRLFVAAAHLSFFWLKYLDAYVTRHPAAFNAASGFYFLGRRSECVLSDRDLIALYRGT